MTKLLAEVERLFVTFNWLFTLFVKTP